MNIDILGLWRNLSWGCAYAGHPSLQIQLEDIGVDADLERQRLTIPFFKIPQILGKQIRRYHLVQIHAVSFNARGHVIGVGDPLKQHTVYPLIAALLSDIENRVVLHVNNQTDISKVDPRANIVVMPVMPSRGNVETNFWANLNYLSEDGEILFLLADDNDYEWTRQMDAKYRLTDRFTVHLAVRGSLETRKNWAKRIIKDDFGAYLLPEISFTPLPVQIDHSFRLPKI